MSETPTSHGCGCNFLQGFDPLCKALEAKNIDPIPFLTSVFEGLIKPPAEIPPHIFHNGIIRSMKGGDAETAIEALAVHASEIKAAGSLEQCRQACPDAVIVDLQGKTILPGFVEPHVHMLNAAIFDMWVQLGPFDGQRLVGEDYTLDWALKRMREALEPTGLRANVHGGWLCGFGLDPSMFSDTQQGEWQNVTRDDLDSKVSADVAIFILNSNCHLGYANSKALKAAASDNTTGVLAESHLLPVLRKAISAMAEAHPLSFAVSVMKKFHDVLRTASTLGVTLMWDALLGGTQSRKELEFFDLVARSGVSPVRMGGAIAMSTEVDLKKWTEQGVTPTTFLHDMFRVPCVKIFSDGSNQGLTGYQFDDYPYPDPILNKKHPNGIWNLEDVDYIRLLKVIDEAGWTLMVHGNGDQAISRVIEGYTAVCEDNVDAKVKRNRIEHCSLASEEMLASMANCGVSPSFLIGHVGYWGKSFSTKVFKPEKADGLDPAATALSKGLRFTLHSDCPVSPVGPLRMVEQAVMRVMEADPDGAVLNEKERVSMAQALRAITYDAAWQCHMDDLCGELVEGKKADFVILEKDPMSMADNATGLRDIKVCETRMNGKVMNMAQ